MIGSITFEAEILEVSLLSDHDDWFHTILLLHESEQQVETFDVDVVGRVGHNPHHRGQLHGAALHGRLEVVELSLGGIVAVVTMDAADGETRLAGLSHVGETAGVSDAGTVCSHNINKLQIVLFVNCRPVHSPLTFGY